MMHVCLQHIYSVYARNSGRCVLLYSHSMYLSAICVELVVDNGLYSLPYLLAIATQESSQAG